MKRFRGRADVKELCQWADVSPSSFHYRAHPGEQGMKASTHTGKGDQCIENQQVVEEIREILAQDYCAYGYQMVTQELRSQGYRINPKKVYRLMRENKLLCGKVIRTKGRRNFVRFRRIQATRPMECLCLDIKYVWVTGDRRWYYQLAIQDVYSRKILCWIFQASVRQADVIRLMRQLDLQFGLKGVMIRNDNGSQFIAHKVREALQDMEARQEFTHVATPEENAYIESFHAIQQRELMDRFTFEGYYDAKRHIELYMLWYNTKRRHRSLKGITPEEKWAQGWACTPVRQSFGTVWTGSSRPAEAFSTWLSAQPHGSSLDDPVQPAYLSLIGEQAAGGMGANSLGKNVQLIGG